MEISVYLESMARQDTAAIVMCDLNHKIIYMNPAADKNYAKDGGYDLIGKCIFDCHNSRSKEMIIKVVDWMASDKSNNRIHTFYNKKQNKDVYMVALRDAEENLIGYYEKHEFRDRDMSELYMGI